MVRAFKALSVIAATALMLVLIAVTTGRAATANGAPAHPKRGIASAAYLSSDPARLAKLGATWAYDWSAAPPPHERGLQWVPMVWGAGSVNSQVLARLAVARKSGTAHYLLGFNEPDNAGQSNMTPSQAAALWPKLEKTGLQLGSPAPAVPSDGWLGRFMTIARQRHLRVSFIALHYYQDVTDPHAVQQLKAQLIAIHRQFHRPIWITEIGALNIAQWGSPMEHPPSPSAATAYLRRLFGMLDGLSFVQRYAWFTDECWNDAGCRDSSLFTSTGRVTSLGRAFRSAP